MTPDVTIRRATEADIDDIQQVAERSWHAAYDSFVDEEIVEEMLSYGYSVDFLAEAIESPNMTLFVAEAGGNVVGYVSCEPPAEDDVGQVSIYVEPDFWGEGIGSQLLDRAEAHFEDAGATALRDVVLADNEVGNAFYRTHFERVESTTVELGGEEFDANVYTGEL